MDKYVAKRDIIEHPSLHSIKLEWQAKKEKEEAEERMKNAAGSSNSLLSNSVHSTSSRAKKAGRQKSFKELQAEKNRKMKAEIEAMNPLQFILPSDKDSRANRRNLTKKSSAEGSIAFLSPYRYPEECPTSCQSIRAVVARRKQQHHDFRATGAFLQPVLPSPQRLDPSTFNPKDGISENNDEDDSMLDHKNFTRSTKYTAPTSSSALLSVAKSRNSLSISIEKDFVAATAAGKGFQVKDYTMDAFRYQPPVPIAQCISYEVDMEDLPQLAHKDDEEVDIMALAATSPGAAAAALALKEQKKLEEEKLATLANRSIFEVNKDNYAFNDRTAFNNIHYRKINLPSISHSKHSSHHDSSPGQSQHLPPSRGSRRPQSPGASSSSPPPPLITSGRQKEIFGQEFPENSTARPTSSSVAFFDHPSSSRHFSPVRDGKESSEEMDVGHGGDELKGIIKEWYRRNNIYAPKRYNRKKEGLYMTQSHPTSSIVLDGLLLEVNPYTAEDSIIRNNLDKNTDEMEV